MIAGPDRTPVLVGIGVATQREEDASRALEPMDLMLQAVAAAGRDTGVPPALRGVQYIAVPKGRWSYSNPAGEIARNVGAERATTVLSSVGVLQQTLIGEACTRIADGEVHTSLVAGADAGYRLLRAQISGTEAVERVQGDAPDLHLAPQAELRHPVELRAGLTMPVGLYAIMESAYRARRDLDIAQHRDRLATLGERFSRIAAANPHAWRRAVMDADDIREPSASNPMQAFPYTRAHCSSWNVDQAAALLFCSAERAEALGIPRAKWIFPVASTEANHMVAVSARPDLADCPGARLAGEAALGAGGLEANEIDLLDLYSCFPLAVETYAEALGQTLERDLTFTGGMAYAGGPYNNYLLQAVCRAAELLREGRGRNALISCVSGVLTKQAFGLWTRDPGPSGFVRTDVTEAVAQATQQLEVLLDYSGEAVVAGCTVLHGRNQAPRGVALVDTPQGARAMTTTEDATTIARMQEEEFVGRKVLVQDNVLAA